VTPSPGRDARIAPWQVWWVDFDPQVGREQKGVRPAIIVGTKLSCDLPNRLVSLVPCTTTDRNLPVHPVIDLGGRPGVAMCDQMRATGIDRLVRPHPAQPSPDEIDRIRFALRQLIDI
jgi:mRNA interferase MazF